MKKLVAILLLMVYTVSSTGATVQLHYCCGKLKSIKLGVSSVKPCGNQQKMAKGPCCETKEIKAKDADQQVYSQATLKEVWTAVLPQNNAFVIISHVAAPERRLILASPPPLLISLSILQCVFRI